MIPDPDMPLFHLESLLFSVFPYMYICMYSGNSVLCLLRLLRLLWHFHLCVRGRMCFYLYLYNKTCCHILTGGNQTQLTPFSAVSSRNLFCQIADHPEQKLKKYL